MNCDVCCSRVKNVDYFVFVLVIVFAISSWIDINGLWVELPILVENLPEKWNLPSYMTVIIQIANIGPIAFTVSTKIWPRQVTEIPVIYAIILVGAVACLLLTFFWDTVSEIAGVAHSTGLLTLQFFLALVDCTSSVVFYPFLALLKPQYMSALFIGESLSGLLPSLVALGQGAGNIRCVNSTSLSNITINVTSLIPEYQQPKFSIEIFFLLLFAMMILSGIAFTMLTCLPYCKKEFIIYETVSIGTASDLAHSPCSPVSDDNVNSNLLSNSGDRHFMDAVSGENSRAPLLTSSWEVEGGLAVQGEVDQTVEVETDSRSSSFKFGILLLLTMWINALTNGILPSVQSYSCLPYGNTVYHLTVSLSGIASPIACCVVLFVHGKGLVHLIIFTAFGTGLAGYIMTVAVMRPPPLFDDRAVGASLIISTWILTNFVLTYCKVSAAMQFRGGGRSALLWCGVFTQIGSASGALVMFILINQLHYFKQTSPCL